MRRLFRFSIRDLLWLTLVVAMSLTWFLRERRLSSEADELTMHFKARCEVLDTEATRWRMSAGKLEQVCKEEAGWDVGWSANGLYVYIARRDGLHGWREIGLTEPTILE
jgi:hypothetical protein